MPDTDTFVLPTYLGYLTLSIAVTVWVARTLHRNGRAFLVDAFHGQESLADSVNHLLVVGFYLINLGWIVDDAADTPRRQHRAIRARAAQRQGRHRAVRARHHALLQSVSLQPLPPPRARSAADRHAADPADRLLQAPESAR